MSDINPTDPSQQQASMPPVDNKVNTSIEDSTTVVSMNELSKIKQKPTSFISSPSISKQTPIQNEPENKTESTDLSTKANSTIRENEGIEGVRVKKLQEMVDAVPIPPELKDRVDLMIQQASSSIKYGHIASLEQAERYVNLIAKLPWKKRTKDNLELASVKQMLDKHHYGMNSTKERIIEYLAVLKLQEQQAEAAGKEAVPSKAPIMCFVGLVGTGKTTFAISVAEAMGRKFIRIPFGGMGSAADLRGQSRVHPDAEPGHVLKSYLRSQSINPVILLDEIDRVTEEARADIMGVLVEMLDPKQNIAFTDHYLDYPFDLSQTIFIATANNTKHIATAVMDRIEPIQMPSYSDDEKIAIGRDYVLPRQLKNSGLTNAQLKIDDTIWPLIVRPTGFDAGIRTLERTLNSVCRKVARQIVEGKATSVTITKDNLKQFVQQW